MIEYERKKPNLAIRHLKQVTSSKYKAMKQFRTIHHFVLQYPESRRTITIDDPRQRKTFSFPKLLFVVSTTRYRPQQNIRSSLPLYRRNYWFTRLYCFATEYEFGDQRQLFYPACFSESIAGDGSVCLGTAMPYASVQAEPLIKEAITLFWHTAFPDRIRQVDCTLEELGRRHTGFTIQEVLCLLEDDRCSEGTRLLIPYNQ